MKTGIFRQLRTICLLLLTSLLAMGVVAPLGAFAKSAYHPYLHASFKENIVPTPNAFNFDSYGGIVKGPDGAIWFTESNTNQIGRLDSSGHFREYLLPTAGANPEGITVGPDRALWFAEQGAGQIGRIDVHGVINEFPAGGIGDPFAIVSGPDGALWYASFLTNNIGRITTSGFATTFPYTPSSGFGACGITVGPDHNIYFTQTNGDIGRMSVSGPYAQIITPAGASLMGIVTGPGRNLWFTDTGHNAIGRLNPTTDVVTEFPITFTPNSFPKGITNLGDGTLAFTEFNAGQIGRVDAQGNIREFMIPTFNSLPTAITTNGKGSASFIESAPAANKIGKVTFSVH